MHLLEWLQEFVFHLVDSGVITVYKSAGALTGAAEATAYEGKVLASDVLHLVIPQWLVNYLPPRVLSLIEVNQLPRKTERGASALGASPTSGWTLQTQAIPPPLPTDSTAELQSHYIPGPAEAVEYEEHYEEQTPAGNTTTTKYSEASDASVLISAKTTTPPAVAVKDSPTVVVPTFTDNVMPAAKPAPKAISPTPEEPKTPASEPPLATAATPDAKTHYMTPTKGGPDSVPGTPEYNSAISPVYDSCTEEEDEDGHSGSSPTHSVATTTGESPEGVTPGKKQSRTKRLGKRISKRLKKVGHALNPFEHLHTTDEHKVAA